MANNFKKVIDRQEWVQVAAAPNAHAAAMCMTSDLRTDVSRNPFVYQLVSNTLLNRYNIVQKAWAFAVNPTLSGTFGVGAQVEFAPSQGLKGALAASGHTASKIVIGTAFPTAVGLNMLANRGGSGDFGFKIRIVGKTSGKVEERYIVGNTASTTPTIDLDTPLSFTPASGDLYEILSGRVFMLGAGVTALNSWRSREVASNFLSVNLSITGLPATIATDTQMVVLDEQYTPYDMLPGEGLVIGELVLDGRRALSATASGANTLTGQAAGGDSIISENEFRNDQIRIVQDLVNPAAVNQRGIIASHTGGASPVYTIGAAWGVQPSSSAKFVIEKPNLILARSSGTTTVYTWNYNDTAYNNGTTNLAANAWSTTCFAAAPAINAASGQLIPSWGINPDVSRNARQSFIYNFRGNAATTLDVLDTAGGTTGLWTSSVVYDGAIPITVGSCSAYSPFESEGRMAYMNVYTTLAINQMFRFDVKNRVLSLIIPTDWVQSGTAAVGQRMAAYCAIDGTDNYDTVLLQAHTAINAFELVVMV